MGRVLSESGRAVFVVGNSNLRGVFISNSNALKHAAELAGLSLVSERERDLPGQHRYLPPPAQSDSMLAGRMRTEVVLAFAKG